MIFAAEGHIGMIRNGLFWYEGIDKPDWSAKGMKEYHTQRTLFLADRLDISKEVKDGLHPLIEKTQTRRLNRGIYQVGKDYAVQTKRGVKAEPDIRIVMDVIWEETVPISKADALAEGWYTQEQYEMIFRGLNPKWDGQKRWAFKFHVVGVREK